MPLYPLNPQRKPDWLKRSLPQGEAFLEVKTELKKRGLATVCEEASCPNLAECWSQKTATMMILGDTCTRACRFCDVNTGNPQGFTNPHEPEHASEMVKIMGLNYIVITSVDRDDLADQGAGHFARVVDRVKADHPQVKVEVLIPDFSAKEELMHVLAQSHPYVIAQNLETVRRLTHPVRDRRAGYETTLRCLEFYKKHYPQITTKTSLMVGLGETHEELYETMQDLRKVDVDILTFGQYLQPTQRHLTVERFYHPDEFAELKRLALRLGFKFVASGPMVRSSYKAADYLDYVKKQESLAHS